MRKKPFIIILTFFFIWVLTCGNTYSAALQNPIEEVVLKGNWQEVFQMLQKDQTMANDPIVRLLMGHACLATNRNNASVFLFLSTKNDRDMQLWSDWTESLALRNPQNPIALYLFADAKARQGRFNEAIEGLTQSIEKKSDFAMALNARGIVQLLSSNWNDAVSDFSKAIQSAPDFADAYANLGTYWILMEAPDGALEAFSRALTINPDFALAYNGCGCAYFGKGLFEEASVAFRMASQLSPILVTAEINQGFTAAYASKLITLSNEENKPGTNLEFKQQYKEILNKQNQDLMNTLPSQKDQEFWRKIDALPWILQSEEKTQSLVKEYGLQKVQLGAFIKMQELKTQIEDTHTKVQHLNSMIGTYDRKIWNLQLAEFVTSLGFSALGTGKDIKKGWEFAQLKIELRAEKKLLSLNTSNSALKAVIDAIPVTLEPLKFPVPWLGSIASSGFKIGKSVLEDKRGAIQTEFESHASRVPVLGAQLRAMETNLSKLGGPANTRNEMKISSTIPGYYTSIDRPLTEIGTLASMVDKGIKPVEGSRTALIVSQDPFRANLLQSELNKYGFQTKILPFGTDDPQIAAKQMGASVILGVRGIPNMEIRKMGSFLEDPSKKYYDDTVKKMLPPPFPPDKGGGAVGAGNIQKMQPLTLQNWDWGKPFVPLIKNAPGGIRTEDLAKTFVDRGNWPVMTTFGLCYGAGFSEETLNVKESASK